MLLLKYNLYKFNYFKHQININNLMFKPKPIVFDMDGVLRVGNNAIPNTNDIINLMAMNNIPGMISTNECRYTDIELREELSELGINIPNKWCIYTAGMAVRDFLKKD